MKKTLWAGLLALIIAASFLAGSWYTGSVSPRASRLQPARSFTTWTPCTRPTSPINRAIAPDCGMELVPVYDDGSTGASTSGPPGTVTISSESSNSSA